MGNKKNKQPGNTPAKKATQNITPDVCIRCPDRETAEKKEHRNDLNKCFNDFPSRQIGDEPATHAIDELWWGFSNGKVSADLDLSKPAVCDELLEYAKTVGKEFQPHRMDSGIEESIKSAGMVAAKRDAKWKLPQEGKVIPISKEMLEAALEAVQGETAKKTAQAEKLKAEKAMRKAGTSVLGQDATVAGSSSKVSADTKGNSSGTGSAATETVSSGGKPLRGGPPTTDGIFVQTGSAQEVCPRCPVNSPYHHAHAIAPDGLLDCYGQIQPGIGSTLASDLDKLWPRLRLDRSELGPGQLSSYDAVNDRLHSDPDLAEAKAIVQSLRQGGTQYKSVLLTKGLAEYALLLCHQAQREPVVLDESDPEDSDPSTRPPFAPNPTVSTYSNPTHTNEMTGVLDQHTDHDRTLKYTRDVALRMLRNAGRDLDNMSKAKLEQEIGEVSKSFGLRTSFASKAHDHSKVSTNHLGMQWPTEIHVYAVEMIRTNRTSIAPVTVKKNTDKRRVIEMLKNTYYAKNLNNSGGNDRALKWVTDGDLIWSVVPLFHANDPTVVPESLVRSASGAEITYDNEMGVRLTLEEITITLVKTINLARSMGEMFYDTTTATYDDSDPGLITRGLNAFFSRFASETPGNVSTSANKSFVAMTQRRPLDSNPAQRTLAALKGFFLSVRPGIDSMYLNVNHATSPFFEEILVSEFVTRARQAGRSEGEIRAVLKGVKVRIIYQTSTPFKKEDERYRFITCVGSSVRASDGTTQIRPDIGSVMCRPTIPASPVGKTVYHWYTAPPNSPPRTHKEFPAPPLMDLPQTDWAVNVGGPISKTDSVAWYPASQLRIAPQQLFRGRLTGSQTTQMLNVAVQTPDPHRTSILKQGPNNGMFHLGYAGNSDVRAANSAGGNQSLTEPSRPAGPLHQAFLQAVNMQAEIEMIRIPGKWLSRPKLVYSPRGRYPSLLPSNKPGTASWDLRDRVFATQADFRELAVLDLQARSMQPEPRRGFIELLCTQLLAHGLIPPREEREVRVEWQSAPLISNTMDLSTETRLRAQLKTLLGKLHQPYPPILVLLDYSLDTYACVKRVADLELGIQTICAASGKAVLRWSPQTVSNVALKFNMKGARGGRDNHHFDGKDLRILWSADEQADTVVIGADVTHPGKGSAMATPSIAAVVGSADDQFMQFPGSMRLQRGSKEDITDLSGMVKERLLEWASRHNKTLPTKVLFYRDGVSESQYNILRRRELPQVQIAMNEAYRHLHPDEPNLPPTGMAAPDHSLANWKDISRPNRVQREREADEEWAAEIERQSNNRPFQMTFVVVGKRHNTRFYPEDEGHTLSKLGRNVKPGLVVDEVITHPYSMDFYLQSHEPIKGTGRSAHYFVLQNNMGLTADELQSITHTFCYAYARATRGVSYCAPAYYADRLCDRGRAYMRYYLINHPAFQPRHRRDQSPNAETHDQYAAAVIASIENDPRFRPQPGPGQTRRMNPWHEDVDDTMFYL
ncbi:hypothetical protein LTR29_012699 [Friedmanniomyces endolithicus]|nr:hypothetical protein LTR29_012699 [Friedmanniomyces endolithicus]